MNPGATWHADALADGSASATDSAANMEALCSSAPALPLPTPLPAPDTPRCRPADCFKWGYNASFSVVGLKVARAADVLGIDLAADLGLSLSATDIIGKTTTLQGSFVQVPRTKAECQCAQEYRYNDNVYKVGGGSIASRCTWPCLRACAGC